MARARPGKRRAPTDGSVCGPIFHREVPTTARRLRRQRRGLASKPGFRQSSLPLGVALKHIVFVQVHFFAVQDCAQARAFATAIQ